LVLDVSTKPLISFVWLGTILVVVGIVMAIFIRRKDLETIPAEG
jgi:cytochrome c biogenesis factor